MNLQGIIKPEGYLVLRRPEVKFTLNITDGEVSLFDSIGKLVDHQNFFGAAPEGESFALSQDGMFVFTEPTLGGVNKFTRETGLINNSYPVHEALNRQTSNFDWLGLVLGVAAVLTGLIIFATKRNENLSNLFFGRDENFWR